MKKATRANNLFALLFLILLLSLPLQAFDRIGLWVTRDDITTREQVDQLIVKSEALGVTDLFVQVRGRGDAYYNSRFIHKTDRISDPNFDPLDYICSLALNKSLKIHAWFNTYLLYSNRNELPPLDHLFNLFPEWLESDIDGLSDNRHLYLSDNPYEFEGAYLSPIHPRVNEYLFILIKELMQNYTLDGIHFDYIRYQNRNYGFNSEGRNVFQNRYYVNPERFMGNQQDGTLSADFFKLYDEYRRNAIKNLLIRVNEYNANKAYPLEISAAVKPDPLQARDEYFQDWPAWLNDGLVDFVTPMNYNTSNDSFSRNLASIKEKLSAEYYSRIWMGVGIWNQPVKSGIEKMDITCLSGFHNLMIFSYATVRDDTGYYQKLKDYFQK